jgi:hypothetical protein
MAGQLRIPEFLDRNADKNKEEGDAEDPKNNKNADDVGPSFEIWETEDAVIHQKKTKLRPDQIEDIEDLGNKKELGHQDDVAKWNGVCVKTHTAPNHSHYKSDDH